MIEILIWLIVWLINGWLALKIIKRYSIKEWTGDDEFFWRFFILGGPLIWFLVLIGLGQMAHTKLKGKKPGEFGSWF